MIAYEIGIIGLCHLIRNEGLCTGCGTCGYYCRENAIITLGGRRGRHPKIGRTFCIARSKDDVVEIVGKIIYWIFRSIASDKMLPEQLTDEEFADPREGYEECKTTRY